jgi:CBS-domain-containing membrane protein
MLEEILERKGTREASVNNSSVAVLSQSRILKHNELKIRKRRVEKVNFMLFTFISSFIGISMIAFLNEKLFSSTDLVLIIGSFGATAVIVFGLPESPLARTYNVLVGHVLSSLIGVTAYLFFNDVLWLATALAVSVSILSMQLTNAIHPPAGATALIAVIGSDKIHHLGYFYSVVPVGLGALILVFIAAIAKSIYGRKKKKLKKQFKSFF